MIYHNLHNAAKDLSHVFFVLFIMPVYDLFSSGMQNKYLLAMILIKITKRNKILQKEEEQTLCEKYHPLKLFQHTHILDYSFA